MNDSDMVEAMARGIAEEIGGSCLRAQGNCCDFEACQCQRAARAAIRACHAAGGLVLREVPGEMPDDATTIVGQAYECGHNDALAAVRAAAVEVGEPPHE